MQYSYKHSCNAKLKTAQFMPTKNASVQHVPFIRLWSQWMLDHNLEFQQRNTISHMSNNLWKIQVQSIYRLQRMSKNLHNLESNILVLNMNHHLLLMFFPPLCFTLHFASCLIMVPAIFFLLVINLLSLADLCKSMCTVLFDLVWDCWTLAHCECELYNSTQ